MLNIKYITIDEANNSLTIEKYILKTFSIYNYIYLQKLIRTGQIRVNKKRIRLGYILKTGDLIRLPIINKDCVNNINTYSKGAYLLSKPEKSLSYEAQSFIKLINQHILYQDNHIVAINKPKGLAIQGGRNISVSLSNLLPYIKLNNDLQNQYSDNHLKIVHRLDKDTTGVLLLAKTNAGAKHLFAQFKEQKIQKIYYCLAQGKVSKSGIIKNKLLKVNNLSNTCKIDDEYGKNAITLYDSLYVSDNKYSAINVTNQFYNISFLKVLPKTGRNHQIRAHLGLSLKCPIIGDFKYGYKVMDLPFKLLKNEIFLHASSITFADLEGKIISIKAPLGKNWLASLSKIGVSIKDL